MKSLENHWLVILPHVIRVKELFISTAESVTMAVMLLNMGDPLSLNAQS